MEYGTDMERIRNDKLSNKRSRELLMVLCTFLAYSMTLKKIQSTISSSLFITKHVIPYSVPYSVPYSTFQLLHSPLG